VASAAPPSAVRGWLPIRQNILPKNDLLAAELRRRFVAAGVGVVNVVSSPGSGKTTLLESTLQRLQPRHSVAALVGDLATDRDAQRLSRAARRVQQITTGTVCHLDAEMIAAAINGWALDRHRRLQSRRGAREHPRRRTRAARAGVECTERNRNGFLDRHARRDAPPRARRSRATPAIERRLTDQCFSSISVERRPRIRSSSSS